MSNGLTSGHLEDLRNHFNDGYTLGRQDELHRCMTLIDLDLLLPKEVKSRILDLLRGGKDES
jgi:hypothetical protein